MICGSEKHESGQRERSENGTCRHHKQCSVYGEAEGISRAHEFGTAYEEWARQALCTVSQRVERIKSEAHLAAVGVHGYLDAWERKERLN